MRCTATESWPRLEVSTKSPLGWIATRPHLYISNLLAQPSASRRSPEAPLSARSRLRLPRATASLGQPAALAALAGHTSCGLDMGPHVLSSRGKAEGSVETVCTRLRVGLHERSSSARSCGAVRAKILSISEATSGWYWKTATWFVLGSGLGLR